jgi:hypothetical protein
MYHDLVNKELFFGIRQKQVPIIILRDEVITKVFRAFPGTAPCTYLSVNIFNRSMFLQLFKPEIILMKVTFAHV